MKQYIDLVQDVLTNGRFKMDRTGVGCYSVFGRQARFDLSKGEFPLLTTKKMFTRGIIEELLWILSGSTDNNVLKDKGVNIWNEWATETGELGPIYGEMWRNWIDPNTVRTRDLNIVQRLELIKNNFEVLSIIPKVILDNIDITLCKVKIYLDDPANKLDSGEIKPDLELDSEIGAHLTKLKECGIPDILIQMEGIDQISELIHNLKTKPFSRRHVVSAWNPTVLPDESKSPIENAEEGKACLASCHCLFQFHVEELTDDEKLTYIQSDKNRLETFMRLVSVDKLNKEVFEEMKIPTKRLSCQLYQRSCDLALGVPYNIASYALLTMMVAQCVDMIPGEFVHTYGDLHLYQNHIDVIKEQIQREPFALPQMKINPDKKDIDSFTIDDFELVNYSCHDKVAYEIAV